MESKFVLIGAHQWQLQGRVTADHISWIDTLIDGVGVACLDISHLCRKYIYIKGDDNQRAAAETAAAAAAAAAAATALKITKQN